MVLVPWLQGYRTKQCWSSHPGAAATTTAQAKMLTELNLGVRGAQRGCSGQADWVSWRLRLCWVSKEEEGHGLEIGKG